MEAKWHSPNVTLGSVLAIKKIGLWDQSQCHGLSVIGIDPNVKKKRDLGTITYI